MEGGGGGLKFSFDLSKFVAGGMLGEGERWVDYEQSLTFLSGIVKPANHTSARENCLARRVSSWKAIFARARAFRLEYCQ